MAANKKTTTKKSAGSKTKTSSGTARKNTSTRKAPKKNTASARKTTNKKKQTDQNKTNLYSQILFVCYTAILAFLFVSNFGLCGKLGNKISESMFHTFGCLNYIVPILIFLLIQYLVYSAFSGVSIRNTFTVVLLFASMESMLEVFPVTVHNGGGSIGQSIYDFSVRFLGRWGTGFIIIVVMVLCLAILTEGKFIEGARQCGYYVATYTGSCFGALVRSVADGIRHIPEFIQGMKNDMSDEVLVSSSEEELESIQKAVSKPTPKKRNTTGNTPALESEPKTEETEERKPVIDESIFDGMIAEEQEAAFDGEPVTEEPSNPKKSLKKKDRPKMEEVNIVIDDSKFSNYQAPPIDLLQKGSGAGAGKISEYRQTAIKLQQTLESFGVNVTITNVSCGPSVTRYEMQPEQGTKVSKIVALSDDIKLNLAATDIRIEAPIPGKSAVGIEVPNKTNTTVHFRDLIDNEDFRKFKSKLAFAVGKDIGGKVIISDIAKMPHLLIAGATGSGKSVCINTLIMSILYKADPTEVKLIMIDPKVVELSVYDGIPHLLIPVVTDPKKAAGALNWAVVEMTDRYKKFAEVNVRNLEGYNKKVEQVWKTDGVEPENLPKMPQIVIIVDELADLMMVAPGEVEDSIVRLSQLARAAGIHLVIATQRPSVNVITGLIKANVPSRIAFAVSSGVDSRTIIDMIGAEKLMGKGDMLFYPQGYQKPARVQGAFISDQEVGRVVEFLKNQMGEAVYNEEVVTKIAETGTQSGPSGSSGNSEIDDYFVEAGRFIIDKDKASIGSLQRVFKIGFNRAARIMDQLADAGVVGPEEGTKPRKILMSSEEFERYIEHSL